MHNKRKLEGDELLNSFRQLASELGRTPRITDVRKAKARPSVATIFRRYGSWRDCCIAAGLTPDTRAERFAAPLLMAALQRLAQRLGRTPTIKDVSAAVDCPSHEAYKAKWGSWTNALIAAGLTPTKSRQKAVAGEAT